MKRFILIAICMMICGNTGEYRKLYTINDNIAICNDDTKVIIIPYSITDIG